VSEHKLALKEQDLKESRPVRIDVEGKPIVLIKVNGKVFAMDAVCSHEGGPLEDSTVEGYNLTCPRHNAVFDIRNAKVSDQTPWAMDLLSFSIKVEQNAGNLLVDFEPSVAAKKEGQQQLAAEPAPIGVHKIIEQENMEYPEKDEFTLLEKHEYRNTDTMSFKFGNHHNISQNVFNYIAGQFAIFDIGEVYNDPEGPVRDFSIASSPTEEEIMISTRIRDTPYKKRLSSLEIGAKVKVSKPLGKFVLHDDNSKPAVLLSGGIGVTPFRSMIKYATDKQLPMSMVMFDSNKNISNILYKEEFDECLDKNQNLKIVYTITQKEDDRQATSAIGVNKEWRGEIGRIDEMMITKYLNDNEIMNSIFYICGPPGMVDAMKKMLQERLLIPKDRIRIEEFTGY
jgi:glycine betaine catabolism B